MLLISFPNGTDWFKSNWVFRQLGADVGNAFPNDPELLHLLEVAEAFGHLDLQGLDESLLLRTLSALRTVCTDTIQEKIPGWKGNKPADIEGHRMYSESIHELLGLIDQQIGPTN